MKSIIKQLEKDKKRIYTSDMCEKCYKEAIDRAIAIVKAGRDKYKKRMCLGSHNRNPDKCNCENCKIHDEIIGKETEK